MSAVNEAVVREYFESLGYLVTQPRKYTVPGRQKTPVEEIDLVVCNPQIREQQIPGCMVWGNSELRAVARAVVAVRGWHTERFYASTCEQTPDILRFVEEDSITFASQLLGSSDMAKVLCIPRLPASGELKRKTIDMMREKGIDGVISFQTMLAQLISVVDTNRNYEKSDLLQTIRLLKIYDFLKDAQLELFGGRSPRKKRTRSSKGETGPRDDS